MPCVPPMEESTKHTLLQEDSVTFLLQTFTKTRKKIEILFSQLIVLLLVIKNFAKKTSSLFSLIVGKVSTMTALQYIKYIETNP